MSAEAITVMPLLRPRFDNVSLGNGTLWAFFNAPTLARYWIDQNKALGMSPTEHMEDFEVWLRVQHDMEMALHGPIAKLPHGASL